MKKFPGCGFIILYSIILLFVLSLLTSFVHRLTGVMTWGIMDFGFVIGEIAFFVWYYVMYYNKKEEKENSINWNGVNCKISHISKLVNSINYVGLRSGNDHAIAEVYGINISLDRQYGWYMSMTAQCDYESFCRKHGGGYRNGYFANNDSIFICAPNHNSGNNNKVYDELESLGYIELNSDTGFMVVRFYIGVGGDISINTLKKHLDYSDPYISKLSISIPY